MPKVIVPGNRDSRFDLSDLRRFGEVVFLDIPGSFPDTVDEMIPRLIEALRESNFDEGDYLALVGDPVYMAAAAAFMSEYLHEFNLLRYDKKHGAYYPVKIDFLAP
jgi:hypothetical protein